MAETAFHLRGRIAGLSRSRPAEDPELVALRQQLKEVTLTAQIHKALASGPALAPDQRQRLAGILQGGAA